MSNKQNNLNKKKVVSLCGILLAILIVLMWRLAYFQILLSGDLQQKALNQRMQPLPIEAKRGIIYDRNKKILAVSVSADSVYAMPNAIKNPQAASTQLAAILHLEQKDVLKKLTQNQSFVWLKRKATPEESKALKKAKIYGVAVVQEGQRIYPQDNLASHLLGFAGVDNQGLNGLEWSFDEYLRGSTGTFQAERDGHGKAIPAGMEKLVPAKDGNSLILTIDETIQHIAEREIEKALVSNAAKSATVIIMDPKTGEILALANKPDFNPNAFLKYKEDVWSNNAVSYNYEPGSTFKIITASAAVEENIVKPDDRFFCGGGVTIGDRFVKCHKHEGHGPEDFREVVKNSCNPGFISVGMKLGKDKFREYIEKFGFGKKTGVSMQGEAWGIVKPAKDVYPIDVATNSIGQGIAVTPIQLVTAVSAVANGGTLMKPLIVKKITETNGDVVKEFKPTEVRRVITPETASIVGELLEGVVSPSGGGKNAYLDGYNLAGKTGTAQIAAKTGGYAENQYVASFVGYGPVEDPRFVVLVLINRPSTGVYYGGQIAAPVFREIARGLLRYMEIPPNAAEDRIEASKKEEVKVPDLTNMMAGDAKKAVKANHLELRIVGNGNLALDQSPKPGTLVAPNTTVIAYFKESKNNGDSVVVPSVYGKSMREAALTLGNLGLKMRPNGSGVAKTQSPAAGAKVKKDSAVVVNFNRI